MWNKNPSTVKGFNLALHIDGQNVFSLPSLSLSLSFLALMIDMMVADHDIAN